ncbi:MAG: apolipoprotein N-acyltransferase [Gammaproteobacteria bacterium]|nr:apolipoprotein N-acyltransferase [Gammaproteobacteria bacterium]
MLVSILNNQTKSRSIFLDTSALISGLLLPFAFAPFDQAWLVYFLMAWMCLLWLHSEPGQAFRRGWLFGFGQFGVGIHWIFYSLYFHGGAPVLLAVIMVVLMASCLALFPALAGFIARRFFKTGFRLDLLLVIPLCWLLTEWLRGFVLTGFPWLQLGYSQIDMPVAGFATLFGGLGTGLVTVFCSALLALAYIKRKDIKIALMIFISVWLAGYILLQLNWVEPAADKITVSIVQGNIAQKDKWQPYMYQPTLELYKRLTQQHRESDVIIWPETAIPDFQHRVTDYLAELRQDVIRHDKDLLLGLFIRDQVTGRYYNSVISLRDGVYQKRHLVPLGEYIPFRGMLEFFNRWINIPMSDIDSGKDEQPLINVAGQAVGINICFEDAFDREVLKSVPEARLLVNVSNDAWFEDSPEAWQHHQIARMRALETGRYLLRATNTGVSSVIDHKGQVVAIAPQFKRHVLIADVQPLTGSTPYVIWHNYLLAGLSILVLGIVYMRRHKYVSA